MPLETALVSCGAVDFDREGDSELARTFVSAVVVAGAEPGLPGCVGVDNKPPLRMLSACDMYIWQLLLTCS